MVGCRGGGGDGGMRRSRRKRRKGLKGERRGGGEGKRGAFKIKRSKLSWTRNM